MMQMKGLRLLILSTVVLRLACGLIEFKNISSVPVVLYSTIPDDEVYICVGGLQVDLRDESQLIAGICTLVRANKAGGFVHFDAADLSKPLTEIVGSANDATPQPGDWDITQKIQRPHCMYQTSDAKRISFVDANSCVREYDRDTRTITTVIGNAQTPCGEHSLDVATNIQLVYGMAYDETSTKYYLALINYGVYVYEKNGSGDYTGRWIIPRNQTSVFHSYAVRQLYRFNDYIWHKVRDGVNRYTQPDIPASGSFPYDNITFVRFISSSGANDQPDQTAWYQIQDDPLQIGQSDTDMSMGPDGVTLMMADNDVNRLFFLDTTTGNLTAFCVSAPLNSIPIHGTDVNNCTFVDIRAAVWLTKTTIYVYERVTSAFRVVEIEAMDPTVVTTEEKDKLSGWAIFGILMGVFAGCSICCVILHICLKYCCGYKGGIRDLFRGKR